MGTAKTRTMLEAGAPSKPKRGPGGACTPRLRPDGRWEVRFRTTDRATHNRVRKSVYGATQSEALEAMRRFLEDPVVAGPPSDAGCTVRTWVAYWSRVTLEERGASEADCAFARALILGVLNQTPLALMPLRDVEGSDITQLGHDTWRLAMASAAVSGTPSRMDTAMAEATTRAVVSLVGSALDAAVREGLLRNNPARAEVRSARPGW